MKFDRKLFQNLMGEFTGTAMLVLIGCMVVVSDPLSPKDISTFGWGWAFVVALCVHIFAYMSGAHFNPWVSICATILGQMEIVKMLLYLLFQLGGALLGSGLLFSIKPKYFIGDMCLTIPHPRVEKWQAIGLEFLATSTLLFACCGAWDKRSKGQFDSVSLRIGLVVGGVIIMSASYTGASLNFARTLAPALLQGNFKDIWVYFVGQLAASIIVPLFWRFVLTGSDNQEAED